MTNPLLEGADSMDSLQPVLDTEELAKRISLMDDDEAQAAIDAVSEEIEKGGTAKQVFENITKVLGVGLRLFV